MSVSNNNNGTEGIHVYIRVRPPISNEIDYETAIKADGMNSISVVDKKYNISCDYEKVFIGLFILLVL